MSNIAQQRKPAGIDPANDPRWEAFVSATDAAQFCRSWLELIAADIPGASLGAVLAGAPDGRSLGPIAAWPADGAEIERLTPVIESAVRQSRMALESAFATEDKPACTRIAYPLLSGERVVGAIALEFNETSRAQIEHAARQMHWGLAWLLDLFARREIALLSEKAEAIGTVSEALAVALRNGPTQRMLLELVNHIARRNGYARVAIGLPKPGGIRLEALSDTTWVERDLPLLSAYSDAMEEAVERREILWRNSGEQGTHVLDAMIAETAAGGVLVAPLFEGAICEGALLLQTDSGVALHASDVTWAEALSALLPAALANGRRARRSYVARIKDDFHALATRLFGPAHLTWKVAAAAVLAFVLLMFVPIHYRVNAPTTIEGEVQRSVSAPFKGFIERAPARAGDIVKKGQTMAQFDARELVVERSRHQAELAQYESKLREAMAEHALGDIRVLSAQASEASAQVALADDRIARSVIRAPMDGIVVSGDLSQEVGTPVDEGKELFKLSPLNRYRIILQVDERDIGIIRQGQHGSLRINGMAREPLAFIVDKLTPVASTHEGVNVFRVEARLQADSEGHLPALRPGMEGIGKIETPRRSLGWILTHKLTDWLRLAVWKWMP